MPSNQATKPDKAFIHYARGGTHDLSSPFSTRVLLSLGTAIGGWFDSMASVFAWKGSLGVASHQDIW
jgi:hypothetical protein